MKAQITSAEFTEWISELEIQHFAPSPGETFSSQCALGSHYAQGTLTCAGDHEFCLVRHDIQALRPLEISSRPDEPTLAFCFALQGHLPFRYAHMAQEETWTAGTTNLWVSADTSGYCRFPERQRIQMSEVLLSGDYLARLHAAYPETLAPFYRRYTSGATFSLYPANRPFTPEIMSALYGLQNHAHMGNLAHAYRDAKVLELLLLFLQGGSAPPGNGISPRDYEPLRQAKELLLARLQNPPSLPELARLAGINECKLKKGFKEYFGNTVYGLLLDHRIDLACQYLRDTRQSIQQVAQHCGYEFHSHFSSAFKRKTGISPLEYRRRLQG